MTVTFTLPRADALAGDTRQMVKARTGVTPEAPNLALLVAVIRKLKAN